MLTQINLFSGCGGSSEGLLQAGYHCVDSVEWNPNAAKIHDLNHRNQSHVADITKFDVTKLHTKPDLLWASPSCQKFSLQNPNRGETENDFNLAKAVVAAIDYTKPKNVAIENVPSYLISQSFKIIRDYLDLQGFSVSCKVVQATDYGNASTRSRLIVRARADGKNMRPIEGYKRCRTSCTDAFYGLSNLEKATPTTVQLRVMENRPQSYNYIIERCGYYKEPKTWLMASAMGCIKSHTHHDGKTTPKSVSAIGSYRVAYNAMINGSFYNVTPQMLGLLMGFPLDYHWGDNRAEAAAAIGNSVPINLAEVVGLSLL